MTIRSDSGDVILSGLLHTVLSLLLMGLILFEAGAVVVNSFQLDTVGQDAARAAADALRGTASQEKLEQAVLASIVGQRDVAVDAVTVDGDTVTVTVSRPAPVLLADRIPPLRDRLTTSSTHRARTTP